MKQNLVLLVLGLAAYAATLIFSQRILATAPHGATAGILLSLAPMLPAIAAAAPPPGVGVLAASDATISWNGWSII